MVIFFRGDMDWGFSRVCKFGLCSFLERKEKHELYSFWSLIGGVSPATSSSWKGGVRLELYRSLRDVYARLPPLTVGKGGLVLLQQIERGREFAPS